MNTVLVINSGSSSLKFQMIDLETKESIAAGLIERVTDHSEAFAQMVANLNGALPNAIAHRVVHGGPEFSEPTLITPDVLVKIEQLASLAPLHNPGHAAGIRGALETYPGMPQVAVFDTAFHQTMPPSSYRYAIDRELESKYQIRRYGFHGSSHSFVSKAAAAHLAIPIENFNGIVLHLGNGASVCAVKNGKSFDTSMGLTPLQGLVMGSRSGDIDPAIISYLVRVAGMSVQDIDESLNKNGGLKGMTGHSDLRDVEALAAQGDQASIDAIAVYVQRIRHYIGAYLAEVGPINTLIFTAGVGENSSAIRAKVTHGLEHLGLVLDELKNAERSTAVREISAGNSNIQILVVPTNEELEIALQAAHTLELNF